jgi:hypothetical protein
VTPVFSLNASRTLVKFSSSAPPQRLVTVMVPPAPAGWLPSAEAPGEAGADASPLALPSGAVLVAGWDAAPAALGAGVPPPPPHAAKRKTAVSMTASTRRVRDIELLQQDRSC